MHPFTPGYNVTQRTRMSLGQCIMCGSPAESKTMCRPCLDKASAKTRERTAKRLSEGICACGKPASGGGYTSCEDCRKINRHERARRHKSRRASGLCIVCGTAQSLKNADKCEQHLLESVAVTQGFPASFWSTLRDTLVRQNYRCYYTGEPIALGDNAEVDHMKPKSRFPELKHDPTNLVYTSFRTNVYKGARTAEEFISFSRSIAKQHPEPAATNA